jgi:hypothetical protein
METAGQFDPGVAKRDFTTFEHQLQNGAHQGLVVRDGHGGLDPHHSLLQES